MMDYFVLIVGFLSIAVSSFLGGFYSRKNGEQRGAVPFYTLIYMITATVGWAILYGLQPGFEPGVLLYSLIFCIGFTGANIMSLMAARCGPVSLSNLFLQLALIATALWGIFFWNAPWNFTVGLGLLLVVVALVLILVQKGKGEKITLKWFFFAFCGFLFNATCAIAGRAQQLAYEGQYGNMMMFFALVLSTVISLVRYLMERPQKPVALLKKSGWLPVAGGGLNVLHNFVVLLLVRSSLSSSLIYPVLAVGSIGINAVASWLILKERLSLRQWLGLGFGAIAAVLLSL